MKEYPTYILILVVAMIFLASCSAPIVEQKEARVAPDGKPIVTQQESDDMGFVSVPELPEEPELIVPEPIVTQEAIEAFKEYATGDQNRIDFIVKSLAGDGITISNYTIIDKRDEGLVKAAMFAYDSTAENTSAFLDELTKITITMIVAANSENIDEEKWDVDTFFVLIKDEGIDRGDWIIEKEILAKYKAGEITHNEVVDSAVENLEFFEE